GADLAVFQHELGLQHQGFLVGPDELQGFMDLGALTVELHVDHRAGHPDDRPLCLRVLFMRSHFFFPLLARSRISLVILSCLVLLYRSVKVSAISRAFDFAFCMATIRAAFSAQKAWTTASNSLTSRKWGSSASSRAAPPGSNTSGSVSTFGEAAPMGSTCSTVGTCVKKETNLPYSTSREAALPDRICSSMTRTSSNTSEYSGSREPMRNEARSRL